MRDRPTRVQVAAARVQVGMSPFEFAVVGEYRQCPHGFHHPPWAHSCDGCWCEGERDRREYGWDHDTTPFVGPDEEGT